MRNTLTVWAGVAAVSGLIVVAGPAHAEQLPEPLSSDFHINHADPESSVPPPELQNKKPLEFGYFIQDLIAFGIAAGKAGDHAAEARYYRAFAKAVPTESIAFSKLCEALEAGGQREQAVAACRDALGRSGAELKDYLRFVDLVLAKPTPLTADEGEDVVQVVNHLRETPETKVAGTNLQCEYAVRVGDMKLLQSCSTELEALVPNDPAPVSFKWAIAMRDGDQKEARRLIGVAKATGVRPESIERMTRATANLGWRGVVANRRGAISVAGGAFIAGVAAIVLFLRKRRALRPGVA